MKRAECKKKRMGCIWRAASKRAWRAHLCSAIVLELAAKRVDLRLKVLLARKEAILIQEPIFKVSERPNDASEVCAHALGEALQIGGTPRGLFVAGDLTHRRWKPLRGCVVHG